MGRKEFSIMEVVLDAGRMSPVERIRSVFCNRPTDRVPFVPWALGFAANVAGYKIGQIYTDPQASFRAQTLAAEMFDYDPLPLFSSASYGGWEFGGEMRFPQGEWEQAPVVVKKPVIIPDDIELLDVPDVRKAGNIPGMLHFARMARRQGLFAVAHVGSPFTRAGSVMEPSLLMRWMGREPELVHRVLRKISDFLVNVGTLFVEEFGAENVIAFVGTPLESNQVISPGLFERFSLPYLCETHERLIHLGISKFWIHICGDHGKNLSFWRGIPIGESCLLSIPSEIGLVRAIEIFGEKAIIAGDIDPTLLLTGSPEQVYECVASAITIGKKAPRGYVVMSGCELPPLTPPINVFYMAKAVKECGQLT